MKTLIVIANPNKMSFSHAMAEAYKKNVEGKSGEVKILDLYDFNQPFLQFESMWELAQGKCNGGDKMKQAQDLIAWADETAYFYPTWWGSMPAILKNFFDMNLTAGFAFKYVKGSNFPEKLLIGKNAKVFATCDAPGFVYKFGFILWMNAKAYMSRAILGFCGIKVDHFQLVDGLRKRTDENRKKVLEKIENM